MKAYLPELKLVYKTREDFVKEKISSPSDCSKVLRKMFDADTIEYCEEAILLLLNRANETIGFLKISSGGTAGVMMDQKIIFATALKGGASAIIVAHNHPSGNLTPSQQDIDVTRKLVKCGEFMDLPILDHLIITKESYFSFQENGLI